MLLRILKKDMKRRKSVNIILFLFILLSTVFMASSMNNILVTTGAIDYFFETANVPEIGAFTISTAEEEEIEKWIETEAPAVDAFGSMEMILFTKSDITVIKNGKEQEFETGSSLALCDDTGEYAKILDDQGKAVHVKSGEIAMAQNMMTQNNLQSGDKVCIQVGSQERKFTVQEAVKDAVFGLDMMGRQRLTISEKDYQEIMEQEKNMMVANTYFVHTEQPEEFQRAMETTGFSSMGSVITDSMMKMMFFMDVILAGLLFAMGICLILIALLVLRFTLVFTIEEEYREIGIMKAIGLHSFSIKQIYLMKYFCMVVVGATCGLFLSYPLSDVMTQSVSKNILLEEASANGWLNVLCAIGIVIFVVGFCYIYTGKLDKISAVSAIRGGQTGERYKKRAGWQLSKRKKLTMPVFLGINDILTHPKRYVTLMFTFCISLVLLTIPLNTLNTIQSPEMISKFLINSDSAFLLKEVGGTTSEGALTVEGVEEKLNHVQEELKEKGYDANYILLSFYFFNYKEVGETDSSRLMTIKLPETGMDDIQYTEGEAPVLENEIAVHESIMKSNDWKIGDVVEMLMANEQKSMIITGTYADYMQMGRSVRLNPQIDCSQAPLAGVWAVQWQMETEKSQKELVEELNQKLPKYSWGTAQDIVDTNVGGTQKTVETLVLPMTLILCGVIMLLVLLMERLFIAREKGEIAMLKSMGVKNKRIRLWQIVRMAMAAFIAMIAALPISHLSNHFVLRPIFSIMGANVEIQVDPWMVYGVYPIVLLTAIIIATLLGTERVKKISIQELNNLE